VKNTSPRISKDFITCQQV